MKKLTTRGLHHVALRVNHLEQCVKFFTEIMGMQIEWQPDPDNVYLTSGSDNLALHRVSEPLSHDKTHALDHLGFIIETPAEVDAWHQKLLSAGIKILAPPRTHRDGAHSLYCEGPEGIVLQLIYHPPLVN